MAELFRNLFVLLLLIYIRLILQYSSLVNSHEFLQRSINIGSPGAQIDIGSEWWRVGYLIHSVMDVGRMQQKAADRGYNNLAEFTADATTIVHNVVIFHGGELHLSVFSFILLKYLFITYEVRFNSSGLI